MRRPVPVSGMGEPEQRWAVRLDEGPEVERRYLATVLLPVGCSPY